MFNPRILVVLSGLTNGEALIATLLGALSCAAKPYDLRFAVPFRFASELENAQLPAGTLNPGDVKFYDDGDGLYGARPLLTDETHFLSLRGAYAFETRWDATILSRFARCRTRRGLLTAVICPEEGGAQAYLPAFRGAITDEGVPLGAGLALVTCDAPVKTLLVHPTFLFGETAFLHTAALDADTLSTAAFAAGYTVFALDCAPLWPDADEPEPARLVRPPAEALSAAGLTRFEQLAGISFSARTVSVKSMLGIFGPENGYPQRLPQRLALAQGARTLLRPSAAPMALTVSAFVDLAGAPHPVESYMIRFSYLQALARLPLMLYTGGEQERHLRAIFPNTFVYPDNALLPRTLLGEGMTPMQLFKRNKILLLQRAAKANPSYTHIAWVDIDVLPHPVYPQALPNFAPLMDNRVHLGWVDGWPDTSLMVVPQPLLSPLAEAVRAVTQLDSEMKRGFSERQLLRRLLKRYPQLFTLHPLPKKGLLFLSCLDENLLSLPLRRLTVALPEPIRVPAPGQKKERTPND